MTHQQFILLIQNGTDSRSFVFRVENFSERTIRVSVPHPCESVTLRNDSKDFDRAFYPLTWQCMDAIDVDAGYSASVRIGLSPYWMEIEGVFQVECSVEVDDGLRLHELSLTGSIYLDIPDRKMIDENPTRLPTQMIVDS